MVTLLSGGRLMAAVKGAALLGAAILTMIIAVGPAFADATEDFLARAYPTSTHALTGIEGARMGRAMRGYDDGDSRRTRASRNSTELSAQSARGRAANRRIGREHLDAEWASVPVQDGRASRRGRARGVRVASLGHSFAPEPAIGRGRSLAGGGITWVARADCLVGSLRSVVAQVAQQFGSVTVSSTCRSRSHNSRIGGAPNSHHLTGNAVDFRVHGNVSAAYAFLRNHPSVGGLKHYGGGLFHIDTGARRTW